MPLSKIEIEATILAKGFEPVNIKTYKNLSSPILIRCEKGHEFFADMKSIRKDNFVCPSCIGMTATFELNSPDVPVKNGYRVVSIDQASHKVGISIFDNGGLSYFMLLELTGDFPVRLSKLYSYLTQVIIKGWKPDYLVFEDIQYQDNALTHKTLGMVLGVCVLAATLNEIEHTELVNKVWQSEFNIAGSSRIVQKTNVVKRVEEYYKIKVTDDVADSILMGKYACNKLSNRWAVKLF